MVYSIFAQFHICSEENFQYFPKICKTTVVNVMHNWRKCNFFAMRIPYKTTWIFCLPKIGPSMMHLSILFIFPLFTITENTAQVPLASERRNKVSKQKYWWRFSKKRKIVQTQLCVRVVARLLQRLKSINFDVFSFIRKTFTKCNVSRLHFLPIFRALFFGVRYIITALMLCIAT